MSNSDRSSNGEAWGSKIGVILAVAGSAVGLGNFLRFPGLAASYGGGSFMIPYFIAFIVLGIPICWIEWTMGRWGGRLGFNSAPGIFGALVRRPGARYLGAIGLLIPVTIYMYYVYVESWCLAYTWSYLVGDFNEFGKNPFAYVKFFQDKTGINSTGSVFSGGLQSMFWFFLVTFIINFIVIYRGLSKGIETFCKVAMPLLVISAIIVAVRVLTMPEQPLPEPWQVSIPQAVPAAEWEKLKAELVDPKTDIAKARTDVENEFQSYFKALVEKKEGYDADVPMIPPAGFLKSDDGYAVSLAELRGGTEGAKYRTWIEETRAALDNNVKLDLQQMERHQIQDEKELATFEGKLKSLEGSLAKSNDADRAGIEGRIQGIQEQIESKRKEIDETESARAELLAKSPEGAMPSLAMELEALGIPAEKAKDIQDRSAAMETGELKRNVFNALGYMWNPDFEQLANPEMWLAAAGQIFFSLSVGFGVILNYSSYLRRKDDVVLAGLTASSTNEFCEVCLGGLVAIPATFLFLGGAMTIEVVSNQSTFGLGFNTLPTVFANMPAGRWFAALWFGLLFLAGITSSLSMLQPAIAFLEEGFGLRRRASVIALGFVTFMGALPVIYGSGGLIALDTMDFWIGSFMIFVLATIQVILFGWVLGMDKGLEEAHVGAQMKIPKLYGFIIKYVTPLYLLVVFAAWLWNNAGARVQGMMDNELVMFTVVRLVAIFAFIVLLIHLAGDRWSAQAKARVEVDA